MFFRAIRIFTALFVTILLFQVYIPSPSTMAQTLDLTLAFPSGESPAFQPAILPMSFQPPANADSLFDFAPPTALLSTLAVAESQTVSMPFSYDSDRLLTTGDQLVGVVIEAGTFPEPVMLEFTKLTTPSSASPHNQNPTSPITVTNTISNPLESQRLLNFELEMVTANGEIIDEFNKPVRIVVDLRTLTAELNPVYNSYFLAYQDPDDPLVWRDVDITVHQAGGLISAETLHFSNWAAGVRPERWNPSWTPPAVSAFSGAVRYNYPIEVPPGRNGLQPNVSLSYNSRAIDGRIRDGESGPIADGWSISQISVVRVGVKMESPWGQPWSLHPDKFRLVFNGTGHELFPASDTSAASVRYYVKDAPGYFLERHYSAATPNADGIYWILKTPNGVRYRLGYTADAEEWQSVTSTLHLTIHGHQGRQATRSASAWHVDTVTDSFGNQMTYNYHTRNIVENIDWYNNDPGNPHWTSFHLTTRRNRIQTIAYNYPDRIMTLPPANNEAHLTTAPGSRIEFRASNLINPDFAFLINSIYIYHGSSSNPITEYRIQTENLAVASPGCWNYDVVPAEPRHSHTRIVHSIRRHVATDNDPTTNDLGYALPPTTFSHVYKPHFSNGGQSCFSFYYMSGYQNGYGGAVDFEYQHDNRQVGAYHHHAYNQYQWPEIGYNYSVNKVLVSDGRNPSLLTTYSYEQPCYAQWNNVALPPGGTTCAEPYTPDQYGNLVGYQKTTQTNYDYNGSTILNKQITTFSQNPNTSIGRPTQVDLYNGNNKLLTRTDTGYHSTPVNGLANMFTYTEQVINTQYQNGAGSITISSKVRYEYAPANQGNSQYGNLTHIHEYDSATAGIPYRTTRRNFYPHPTNWMVGLVGGEGIYDGGGTLLRATWYHYDDNNGSANTPPPKGELTRLSQVIPIACGFQPGSGCAHARQTIDTYYSYDEYGNVKTTTTYPDYGYRTFNANWNIITESPPSGIPRITTLTYDTQFNLYPVSVKNPLDRETTFEIYGFRNKAGQLVPLSGFQKQPGLLKEVKDPNNIIIRYEYDPFGRLHAVFDGHSFSGFGDSNPWNGDPVVVHRYWDNSWNHGTLFLNPAAKAPFLISSHQRPGTWPNPGVSNGSFAYIDQTFHDGFGRPIQTRGIYAEVQGFTLRQEIISSTAYNAQGKVACQTTPYNVAFYNDRAGPNWPYDVFINTPCTNLARTTTTYDALGRPLVVTAPDGTTSTKAYAVTDHITVNGVSRLLRTQHFDANNHHVNSFTNARGELVLVREFTGSGPYTSHADTRYTYNVMGNLTHVGTSNPTNNNPTSWLRETTMSYDDFGRKTGMVDADMGTWTYTYDAAGNLKQQKDAKGQQICFDYDRLNRLVRQARDSNPATDCPASLPATGSNHLASYIYDTAANGIGQLYRVSWGPNPSQNRDTFAYDSRGRMYRQTRLIDNRSYVMETTSFDALNRPLIIRYPTNELVTLTYDREGENSLRAGSNTLVSNMTYNGRGQLQMIERPGVADTQYFYYNAAPSPAGSGNGNFRLREIRHGSNSDNKPDFIYTYDRVGNILRLQTKTGSNTDTQDFGYDALNRLTSASASGGVANYSHTYEYDKIGNIHKYNGATYTYGDPAHKQAVTAITGGQAFSYDANGNMVQRHDSSGLYSQDFDVENRLVRVFNDNTGAETKFTYDAGGQRVKTEKPDGTIIYTPFPQFEEELRPATPPTPTPMPTNTPTNTPQPTLTPTPFPTAQPLPTQPCQCDPRLGGDCPHWCDDPTLLSNEGSATTTSSGGTFTIRRSRYSLTGQAIAIRVSGDPVSDNNGLFFYYTDHLGSTSFLLKSNGDFVSGSTARYHPFGSYRITPNQTITNRHYTGHAHNDDLGLIYMNARFYVSSIGRFASADPIVPDPMNPQQFNRYTYVLNNPLRYSDPSGHCAVQPGLGFVVTCTHFNNIEDAEFFLAFINAYLYSIEYDYQTTSEMLLNWAAGETIEDLGSVIGTTLAGKLGGEAGNKIASLLLEFRTVTNVEGLKTLRRFRDDLTSAIDVMSGYDGAILDIAIWGDSGINPFKRYKYSGGGSYHIKVVRHLWGDNGQLEGSERIEGFSHKAGGPFWGATNNFANTVQDIMIQAIPENGGRVMMRKHFTSLLVTPTENTLHHNYGLYTFTSEK